MQWNIQKLNKYLFFSALFRSAWHFGADHDPAGTGVLQELRAGLFSN